MAVILLSIRRLCSDILFFFFSSRRRHTRFDCDWSSDVCSSDLNANVHRGAYGLAIRATEAYEAARAKLAGFVNAWAPEGVVFTRGTTEAINLVAGSYGRANLRRGDSVVVTAMDHHSNLVPWQILCQE